MWSPLPPPHVVTMFLVLQVPAGKGFVCATCSHNSSNKIFEALPVLFGPPLSAEGLVGLLIEARPENACHPIQSPPSSNASASTFIALIHRYNCSFATKVFHAQQAGYRAAVVHNVNSQTLVTMVSKAHSKQKIHIPFMFTAGLTSSILKQLHRSGKRISVILVPGHFYISSKGVSKATHMTRSACRCRIQLPGPCSPMATLHIFWMTCIPMSAVISLLLIEKYLARCQKYKKARNQPDKEKERVSLSFLCSKYQECAICLERYREYDNLKVLSCSHAFHSRCIDLWHMTQARTKTCPFCMQKVMVVTRLQTVRLWRDEMRDSWKNHQFWPGKAKLSPDQRSCWLVNQQLLLSSETNQH